MERKETQKFWEKAEAKLKELRTGAAKIAKGLQEEATYGIKMGKLKVQELGLESRMARLFQQVGTEAFQLVKAGKLKNNKISKLCLQIDKMNKEIKKRKAESSLLRKKLSEGIKKLREI